MTKERFKKLTKELLEECKEEIDEVIEFVYNKPFANIDEEIEYVAILKGKKALED